MPSTAAPARTVASRGIASRANLAALVGLVAAWAVPPLADRLHVDIVLPGVAVLAVAALLRIGPRLLDRLVLASAVLLGGTCAAGLLLSRWRWHLAPVPMSIALFTGLVLGARVARRRPRLRLAVRPEDVACLALAGGTAAMASIPFWQGGRSVHLDLLMLGDNTNHLGIFDVIRVTGGYLFQHAAASREVLLSGLVGYPQGVHLTWAVLANFAASSAAPGPPAGELTPYIVLGLLTYGFFTLCLLWAVNRLTGPARGLWWRLPALVAAASFCAFGPLLTLYIRGFPSQLAGLALLLVLVALLARPGARPASADVLVAAGACVVGVSFAYYFLLPVAACPVVAWAWQHRRALRRRPLLAPLVAAVTAALAAVPVLVNRIGSQQALDVVNGGSVVPLPRSLLLIAVLVFAAGLCRRGVLRERPVQVLVAGVLGAVVFAAALGIVQRRLSYYGEKALYTVLLLTLVGVLALLARELAAVAVAGRLPAAAAALSLSVAVVLAFGYTGPLAEQGAHRNLAVQFAQRRIGFHGIGATLVNTLDQPAPAGAVSVYFDTLSYRYLDRDSSQLLAVLERRWTDDALQVASLVGANRPLDALERIVADSPVPVRIVTSNALTARRVQDLIARYPDRPISVLLIPVTMKTRWGKWRL